MDASTLMGIYGLGQDQSQANQDPRFQDIFGGSSPFQRNALAASLMGGLGKPARSAGEGAGQIGNGILAAMLMNPKLVENLVNGVDNTFSGYAWNGMAKGDVLNGFNNQALGNIAGGAAGL